MALIKITPDDLYSYGKVPIIGPWVGRIGQVLDIMAIPCATTPEIWVRAAWRATPALIWGIFKPDFLDLSYSRFGKRHKQRRQRKFKMNGLLEADIPHPRGVGWARFALLGSLAQRLGFYMIVADVSTQFLVNWTSTAYQYAGCLAGDPEPIEGNPVAVPILGPSADGTVPWERVNPPPGAENFSSWIVPAGQAHGATLTIAARPVDHPGHVFGNPTFRVVSQDEDTFDDPVHIVQQAESETRSGRTAIRFPKRDHDVIYRVKYEMPTGTADYTGSHINIINYDMYPALKPDP